MHDGTRAFPAAVDALKRYRAGGGRVLFLSNAPRPGEVVRGQMERLGIPEDAADMILTSGDATREALAGGDLPPGPFLFVGPDRDRSTVASLDRPETDDPDAASILVLTGPRDDEREAPEDYLPLLRRLRARDVTLVCANPDIVVQRGDRLVPCAGAIARLYEAEGGRVLSFGKPYPPIYRLALSRLAVPRAEVMAIGDGIATDIAGAHGAGIDAVLVMSGIHGAEWSVNGTPDPARARAALDARGLSAVAFMPHLVW
jgi:HAD superfamily hydrolase (TIGR01459 family)